MIQPSWFSEFKECGWSAVTVSERCHGVCSRTGLRSLQRTSIVTGRQEAFLNSPLWWAGCEVTQNPTLPTVGVTPKYEPCFPDVLYKVANSVDLALLCRKGTWICLYRAFVAIYSQSEVTGAHGKRILPVFYKPFSCIWWQYKILIKFYVLFEEFLCVWFLFLFFLFIFYFLWIQLIA